MLCYPGRAFPCGGSGTSSKVTRVACAVHGTCSRTCVYMLVARRGPIIKSRGSDEGALLFARSNVAR
jgi:hypothetical protein